MKSLHAFVLAAASAIWTSCSSRGADEAATPPMPAPAGGVAPSVQAVAPVYAVPVDGYPVLGSRDALVTIALFTDYDCPYCERLEHTLAALREDYPRDVRVVAIPRPLAMHPHARDAARAAAAAAEAGPASAFELFRSRLFDNPNARSRSMLAELAVGSGVDEVRYRRAVDDPATERHVADAEALAEALAVRGTPTTFVNGRRITGAQPREQFEPIVRAELNHAADLVASGTPRERVYDAIVAEARRHPPPVESAEPAPQWNSEAKRAGGAHFIGAADAPTTMLVFVDFECPYSRRLGRQLSSIAASQSMHVVLRHRPLPMHANARLSAKAAIAAEQQGALPAYASALFDAPNVPDRVGLEAIAARLGLDLGRFTRDLDSTEVESRLTSDEQLADRLAVRGTPVSFIEGRRITGAQPIEAFAEAARSL